MPEGPEIRRAADRIERQLNGKPLEAVWFAFAELSPHAESLLGRHVERVETRGKAMLIRFDDGHVLYSHNQLYGVWKLHKADALPDTQRSLRVRLVAEGRAASLYSASDVSLWQAEDIDTHPFLARLGPDLLSEGLTPTQVRERLLLPRFRRRRLGGLLLDQGLVAGLGNYLRSEILFFAELHPNLTPASLDAAQLERLSHAIVSLTQRAYRQAGVTNDETWVAQAQAAGEARRQWRFAVFDRAGLACHRCASVIERLMVGSRRLYLCPKCQSATL
ncbi:endonuclease VIII [Halomonas dongshanensis]|uniref:DNA-(apurinic or apyrimidinic site) lyase n=1 Tax=Halomonas dongshanensis TaxID=2890835 RepID=A0ABT2EHQ8_9GAMM|nr:endonuclease VIII [Halomonas dongshanensis]MCS2610640.1 endonuclease VIII [Halomonas dongshanensis]